MQKLFKFNKNNLTSEEKEELRKNCNVVHSDDENLLVKTDKEISKSDNKITEIHEMNEG